MGIISGALGGLGEAAIGAGRQLGEYASRSNLQAEAAAIAKERDARFEEFASKREIRQETRADAREVRQDERADKRLETQLSLTEKLATLTDTRIREEGKAGRDLQRKQLTESSRHNKSMEGIAADNGKRAQSLLDEQIKNLGLDRTIKELQVGQEKEKKKYRDLATNETDPAKKAIYRETYQLLTGKDNDNFVVNLDKQIDPSTGAETVRGVIKTDKRTGAVTYLPIGAISAAKPKVNIVDPFANKDDKTRAKGIIGENTPTGSW